MQILQTILYVLAGILNIAVVLPLVHSSFWVFRVFEYPRFQKLVLSVIVFCGMIFFKPWEHVGSLVLFGLLFLSIAYLIYKIFPYTPLAKKEMKSFSATDEGNTIKIFSANVLEENNNYNGLLQLIKKVDPDIVFLLETNDQWDKAMLHLNDLYPHCIKKVFNNTYGMIFFTRLEVVESNIHFLVEKQVPSLFLKLRLPDNQLFQLWGLHPKPPLPGENLYSVAKDKELMKVAFNVRGTKVPTIVMGDLNDVAWSHTTELFRKTSELLDPRRGRGFFNTFNAKHWFMRFPLDYIFASTHFTLISMERLAPNGSDHFPILTSLHFNRQEEKTQKKPKADEKELQDAAEISTK